MWLATNQGSGRWEPGIGDPTVMGWLTVFAYLLTALLCAGAARTAAPPSDSPWTERQRRLRRFWFGLTVMLVLLGINKQFDLQTLLTEVGKDLAIEQGWYRSRRAVQGVFVKLVAFVALTTACVLSYRMRKLLRHTLWPLLGMVALLSFIVIRAASFHHIDLLLRSEVFGIQTNWALELSGIAMVFWGAYRAGGGPWARRFIRTYAFRGASPRLPPAVQERLRRVGAWLAGGIKEEDESATAAPKPPPFRMPRRVVRPSPSPRPSAASAPSKSRSTSRTPAGAPREELHIKVRVRDPGDEKNGS